MGRHRSSVASAVNEGWLVVACCLALVAVAVGCDSQPPPSTPECHVRRDCPDGFTCSVGECLMVRSVVGDPCDREADCGPSQTCAVTGFDGDGDGEPDTLS